MLPNSLDALLDRMSASRCMTNMNLGDDSGAVGVTLAERNSELSRVLALDKIDGASAEAASGHASADEAGQTFGRLDHNIEFLATDFIEIAKAVVGLAHQFPYRR
jgi:hypothetical protein